MKSTGCRLLTLVFVGGLFLPHACDKAPTPSGGNSPPAEGGASALPARLFLAAKPDGAKSVEEIRAAAKPGDPIVVRGRIGGSKSPFVEGRAVFTLMGVQLHACSDSPEDKCPTPWDYCCDSASDIAQHSATVQVVDAAGSPIRTGLRGANGLKELSDVYVVGKVLNAEGKSLVLAADGIHVATP